MSGVKFAFSVLLAAGAVVAAENTDAWDWARVRREVAGLRYVPGAGEFDEPARIVSRVKPQIKVDRASVVIIAAVVTKKGNVRVAVPVKKVSPAVDASVANAVLQYRFSPCRENRQPRECGFLVAVAVQPRIPPSF